MVRTTRRGATRHSSARPAAQSSQWCRVRMASATSAQSGRERERRAAGPHRRRRTRRPLLHHDARRLDRHDGPVHRLVVPGAGTDVHHDAPVPELLVDHGLPARVGPAVGDVAQPDGVVDGATATSSTRGVRRRPPASTQPRRPAPEPVPPTRPARRVLRRRLLQDVHAAGRAQPDDVGQPDLGALDLAVAGLTAQVGGHLPHVGDAGGGDRVALGLQAAGDVDRRRTRHARWRPT